MINNYWGILKMEVRQISNRKIRFVLCGILHVYLLDFNEIVFPSISHLKASLIIKLLEIVI